MRVKVSILGATGSIGLNTLEIIRQHPDLFELEAVTANTRVRQLNEIVKEFFPKKVGISSKKHLNEFVNPLKLEVHSGKEGLLEIARDSDTDVVVVGIVGYAGLEPILAAIKAGKRILLANKEALVCAGNLMIKNCEKFKSSIIPIDSEHNAIFQCLGNKYKCFKKPKNVSKIILTASGGPFRDWKTTDIRNATIKQAINHPNWKMGKKISVDSATMINKALEIIEAKWLFDLNSEEIDVVVHPESIIHSMIEFEDKTTLAQLGQPDMKIPIVFGLAWPNRIKMKIKSLDWSRISSLNFQLPDTKKFPAILIARQVLKLGGSYGAVMNASNEVAVNSFLKKQISFGHIVDLVNSSLDAFANIASKNINTLEELEFLDISVRSHCLEKIKNLNR